MRADRWVSGTPSCGAPAVLHAAERVRGGAESRASGVLHGTCSRWISAATVSVMNHNDVVIASQSHRQVFVTWSHTSDRARQTPDPELGAQANAEWRELVFNFVVALRESGINADVDLAHLSDIDEEWTRYGPRAVAAADVVLLVANPSWQEAWNEDGDGSRGRGAAAEADVIRSLFNRDRSSFQGSFVLITLLTRTKSCRWVWTAFSECGSVRSTPLACRSSYGC